MIVVKIQEHNSINPEKFITYYLRDGPEYAHQSGTYTPTGEFREAKVFRHFDMEDYFRRNEYAKEDRVFITEIKLLSEDDIDTLAEL